MNEKPLAEIETQHEALVERLHDLRADLAKEAAFYDSRVCREAEPLLRELEATTHVPDLLAALAAERARAEKAEALAAGLERDVSRLNAEGVQAGVRARAAERERDEHAAARRQLEAALAGILSARDKEPIEDAALRVAREAKTLRKATVEAIAALCAGPGYSLRAVRVLESALGPNAMAQVQEAAARLAKEHRQ